jgi:hypothetical protein
MAFGYTDDDLDGVAMDVTTLVEAWLRFDRVTPGPPRSVVVPLDIVAPETLRYEGGADVEVEPGTYRALVLMVFQSGRRLTVPIDDRNLVRFSDRVELGGS